MIVCTNCGFHNDDDDQFCGGCQEFLEWTGEAVEPDEPDEVAVPVEEEHRGLVERVVDTFTGAGHADASADATVATPAADTTDDAAAPATSESATLVAEAARKADEAAAEAERLKQEAEARARDQAEQTERARATAEEAERVRREAEQHAAEEAAEAQRLRDELEAARAARAAAEQELADEVSAADQRREEAEAARAARAAAEQELADEVSAAGRRREEAERERLDAATEAEEERRRAEDTRRHREEAEERLRREQEELEAVQARLDAAEAARRAAQEQAEQEAEDARAATEAAEAAERARVEAEAKAAEEAAAADRARRAAALVAKPAAAKPAPTPTPDDRAGSTPTGGGGTAPGRPTKASRPKKSRGRKRPAPAPAPEAAEAAPETPAGEGAVAPVKPARSRPRPVPAKTRQEPSKALRPGDLVCGQCGEGNSPDRKFCRRCGSDLVEAVAVKTPFWRRIVPRRAPVAAGERPGRRGARGSGVRGATRKVKGGMARVTKVLLVVAMLGGVLGIAIVPRFRDAAMDRGNGLFTSIRQLIAPEYVPVRPIGVQASSELPDFPADNAISDTSNRWWAEGAPGDGVGEQLVIEFAEPVDIAAVGVIPGAADNEVYVDNPRPRRLHLVFGDGVASADLDITDEHVFQSFDIDGADQVTEVTVQVTDVWQGQSGSDMALTEIQFRTLR